MITLRLVEKKDEHFIYNVYRSAREDELKLTNWSEVQKHAFVTMQLMAQHTDYSNRFPSIQYLIIELKKKSVGRLYIAESTTEIKIIDITILPEYQQKKIGTNILKNILKRATELRKTVRLHVICSNPAYRLYDRLGFKIISTIQDRHYMEYNNQYT